MLEIMSPIIADLLGPFRELAKRRKWDDTLWTPKMDDLFKRVGKVLESAPVLSVPDFGVPFVVATDASQYGVGGSVVPGGGGEEKVYWFWSKGVAKRAEELPSPKEGVTCDAVWVEEVGGNVATSGVHG